MNSKMALIFHPLMIVSVMMSSVALAQDTPKTLMVGVYDSEKGADAAYKEIKKVEDSKAIEVDGFAIVSKDAKGRAHVYNTRQKDARWGAVVGGVIGALVMGPVGVVGGATAGGGTGWLVGNASGISKENIRNIEKSLEPNTSALVAVVDNKWVASVEKAIKARATKTYIKQELESERLKAAQTSQEKSKKSH